MLPPRPPSPPEGPPRGTYFSRRNATQPFPPSPAFTEIFASSTNILHSSLRTLSKLSVLCVKNCSLSRCIAEPAERSRIAHKDKTAPTHAGAASHAFGLSSRPSLLPPVSR